MRAFMYIIFYHSFVHRRLCMLSCSVIDDKMYGLKTDEKEETAMRLHQLLIRACLNIKSLLRKHKMNMNI